jgi:hypothetical protein
MHVLTSELFIAMIPLSEIGAVLPVNPWKLEIKVLMYKNKNVDNKYSAHDAFLE